MEAPAELLAALPALATALALLLAWLLVRRGAAASPDPPEPAPPESATPAEASGTAAPLGPCAAEPAAAPEGPEEPKPPDEPTPPDESAPPEESAAAPAEAEEQAAEERQVRTRPPGRPFPLWGQVPSAARRPLAPPAEPRTWPSVLSRAASGRAGACGRQEGKVPACRFNALPHEVSPSLSELCFVAWLAFLFLASPPPARVIPHPPPLTLQPTGSQIHVHVACFKGCNDSCLDSGKYNT